MCRTSEIDIASIEAFPGNVFYVTIKTGAEIDQDGAKRLVDATNSMMDESISFRGAIYDISGITYMNEDARNYFSSSENVKGTTVAVALISTSFLGRTIGNLFLSMADQPDFPIQFFDSPIRAEHWVRHNLRLARTASGSDISEVA